MGGTGGRGAHLVRVTVLAVVGLVVALCLPSIGHGSAGSGAMGPGAMGPGSTGPGAMGQHTAGDPPGHSTGVAVRGVGDSG
ncbi:hypothetical protein ABIE67_004791 [Streptomyces sp. V4I8]|uniref:hypothetical protein n=1 Tax=Streptomyces sp. V4I8 TaxID=3156469 RepID=UPI003511753A